MGWCFIKGDNRNNFDKNIQMIIWFMNIFVWFLIYIGHLSKSIEDRKSDLSGTKYFWAFIDHPFDLNIDLFIDFESSVVHNAFFFVRKTFQSALPFSYSSRFFYVSSDPFQLKHSFIVEEHSQQLILVFVVYAFLKIDQIHCFLTFSALRLVSSEHFSHLLLLFLFFNRWRPIHDCWFYLKRDVFKRWLLLICDWNDLSVPSEEGFRITFRLNFIFGELNWFVF